MGPRKLLPYLIICLLALVSCEKQVDWPVQKSGDEQVVVFGMITSEYRTQEIRINYSFNNPNEEPPSLTGAQVIVSTTDSVFTFKEDSTRSGYYISQTKFAGKPGNEYTLFISANGTIISGKAAMRPVSDFDILHYGISNESGRYKLTWVADPYNSNESSMYEIFLDWSSVTGYEELPEDSTKARLLYYSLPTIDVSQLFAPET